jgi:hypothetical protein
MSAGVSPASEPSDPKATPSGETAHGDDHSAAPSSGEAREGPQDVSLLVDALKSSAAQEFSIAERLTAKTRQTFALAVGFFTIVQTVAFNSFAQAEISDAEKTRMLVLAISAIACLALAAATTVRADALVASADLDTDEIKRFLKSAYAGDKDIPARLAESYMTIVDTRRKANAVRRDRYRSTVWVAGLSIAITTAELILALVSRI